MQDKNDLSKLRMQRTRLRVIGPALIVLGYGLLLGTFGVHGESANPFLMMLFMFIAVAGIIMTVRSFIHIRFKPLRDAKAAQRANRPQR